jgi:hypothetical protein
MSRNPSSKVSQNGHIPSNLKDTLLQLEGTLSEWEKIAPDEELETRLDTEKEVLEKELQKKARVILDQLKVQIDELSE